ncbi:hypothetical protein [Burkholderia multivorans]|uniref:hypothetical protein n=1 Tax=Burkholderia multivorans TaxID=87883 RepID=UPI0018DB84CD|nr:hypothetical protein [Burkholderia multivorans]MBH9661031.1 hypothetical protein [Burkholderia multivorans]
MDQMFDAAVDISVICDRWLAQNSSIRQAGDGRHSLEQRGRYLDFLIALHLNAKPSSEGFFVAIDMKKILLTLLLIPAIVLGQTYPSPTFNSLTLQNPLTAASGGTNCAIASGTCLDNITGFNSTGLIRRSGSGTYSFGSTVSIGEGGTGATTQSGALTAILGSSTVPVANGGTGATSITAPGGAFDTLCSSTIGQMWVRLTSAWGCSSLGYVNPVWWGADPTGVSLSTSAFTSALSTFGTNGGLLWVPPGTYLISSLSVPISVSIAGSGPNSTTLKTNSATADVLTFTSTGGQIRDLQMASSVTRTGGAYIKSAFGVVAKDLNLTGYFVGMSIQGASSSSLAVGAQLMNVNTFSPAIGAGSALAIFENYSNAVVRNVIGTGPSSGQQPDYGIEFKNGDTAFVSDTNITRHGYALAVTPGAGENNYSLNVTNSDFDSAGVISSGINASSCLIQPTGTGNIYESHFTNVWCGLAAGDGLTVGSTGTGFVDGMHWVAGIFDGNGGSGFHVTTGVKNWSAIGGHAAGNGGAGYYVSAASTDWRIIGVQAGPVSQRGSNTSTGINVGTAASNNYIISHNDVCGNAGGTIFDGGTGTTKYVTHNSCYNPLNGSVTVGASPFTWTNATGAAVTAIVTGGTVSSVTLGGSTVASATNTSIAVPPGQAIVITYSSAPTLTYKGF